MSDSENRSNQSLKPRNRYKMFHFLVYVLFAIKLVTCDKLPGNLTDFKRCKVTHTGIDYMGDFYKTEGNVRCQAWATKNPVHNVHASYTDDKFPDFSKEKAKNYCRNPSRDLKGPWCYTMDPELIDDTCAVPLCNLDVCRLTGPGMEYGGNHNRAASDVKCLKWDKKRKKVSFRGNLTTVDKFDKMRFPDESRDAAKKHCRNPDGDLAGPWCFVEIADSSAVAKQYCDIPFCDDQDCMVFSRNLSVYSHYLSFPKSMTNFSFGIKLWDPDSYLEANAHLVLTLLALPLSGKQIGQTGIGIEILITNKKSALIFGNKDEPEFETTHGVLKSTEYTFFSLNWDRGFLTLNKQGDFKPIFLQEIKTQGNLLGFMKQQFRFYSVQGDNIMWSFPFCDDDGECDVHTTSISTFQNFWSLRETSVGHDMKLYVRAHGSANLLLTPSPVLDYPNIKILIAQEDGYTRITSTPYVKGPSTTLAESKFPNILSYWKFTELSFNIFSDTLSLYWIKDVGTFLIMEVKHDIIKLVRWFSPSSDNCLARWTFNCKPPRFADANPAFLPECALNKKETNYIGTQQVSAAGIPCLPWSSSKWIPEQITKKLKRSTLLQMSNYCRDPLDEHNGTFCYTFVANTGKVEKTYCNIRKCKSAECRMAGTGNDYIGKLNTTRSNRTCQFWVAGIPEKCEIRNQTVAKTTNNSLILTRSRRDIDGVDLLVHPGSIVKNVSETVNEYIKEIDEEVKHSIKIKVHDVDTDLLNDTLYADMSSERAENFCRNPSRSIAGSWCYTMDENVRVDACHVPDCDKNEECTIILLGDGSGRNVFILPQWREAGVHGGIRFSLKQWNPDYSDGIRFEITSLEKSLNLTLNIGADNNQKLALYHNGKLLKEKTMPYFIPSGKWVSLWLQIRQGEILLGFEGIQDTLLEWIAENPKKEANPVFVNFMSIGGHYIGMFCVCDECHAENTTSLKFGKVMPINIWTENEQIVFSNLTLQIRGSGHIKIRLMHVPGSLISHLIEVHNSGENITLSKHSKQLNEVVHYVNTKKRLLEVNSWTTMNISFSECYLNISFDSTQVFVYKETVPMLFYYFSIAVGNINSWVIWVANCDPLDIDGPPKDGGWSAWSPWQCTVTCGGGEGYRTRTCTRPRPNIFGQLCHGEPTSTGKCNEFECGDLSPDTFDLVREKLQKTAISLVVKERHAVSIMNDQELLTLINNESPDAYYDWTLNGQFIEPELGRIDFMGDDILIKNVSRNDAGVYACLLYRINKQRLIIRVVSLAVITLGNTIVTRATLPITLDCKSLSLGYVYTDLMQKWLLNDSIYIDYGITTLAAVSTEYIEKTNKSLNGIWKCVIEQNDLNLQWITNIENVRIKRAPNVYTHLKEDPLTRPIFGKLSSDAAIVTVLICFVVLIFASVAFVLYAYLKWGRLPTSPKKRKRRRKKRKPSKRESSTSITITYKGRWKHTKRKKTDIAVKVLKEEHKERYLKDFLDLAGQWAFLQYNVIVKLYGVTLRKQLSSMVMEYVSLGPLDQYLRDNKSNIQSVDLMEATSNLASALWYLSENGIVHGNIRCKKVLVACHDENHFNVKLSDPGIHSAYSPNEVHWIPVEFYKNLHLDFARRSDIADVWAFGTTVYEMYLLGEPISQGEPTEIVKFYISGNRLPMMKRCPLEVYKILLECWDPDPARRKQPQAIMRDFNQMLYQVYNSRKRHAYAEIKSPSSDTRSLGSSLSFATETTSIAGTEEDGLDGHSISNWSLDSENNPLLLPSGLYDRDDDTLSTYSFHASSLMQSNNASMDGLLSYHPLDDDRVVLVQTKIGQGCYGEVFKGTLEYYKDEKAPKRFVAVKKLKSQIGNERQAADFEREISIMKRLKHKNIVEILGVLSTEGTLMVMEYVPHGSLDSYLKIYKDTMTDKQLLRFASDIAEGMDYLGKMSIVHRDLAARNILVVDENHVKISDFGLAQVLNSENYYITMNPRDLPIRWYALESLTHGKFSTRSDVWSYGVTLSEMYLRGEDPRLPIEAKTDTSEILQLIDAYESGIRLARPILCPQLVYVEVIYPCWNQDPHKRPTFQALCNKISELMPQY